MKSVPKLFDIRSFGMAFRIRWTDFRNLFTEWKRFGCRWSIWTSFLISEGTLPWQPILGKICEMTFIQHPFIFKRDVGLLYRHVDAHIKAALISQHHVKIVKIGSVVFELKWGRKWKLCCDSAEIGLYRRISQQLLNQSLPTFQRWLMYICGL